MIAGSSPRLPRTWVGVNYWSRAGGPRMWSRFDEASIAEELQILAAHELNVTRSFCYLPDFMPRPYTLAPEYVDRFVRFLDLSHEAGVATITTFVVGHMSGANWDVPWRQGRDLYGDGWMLAQQCFLIRELVCRTKDHPAVAGWLLSNEMPLYGGQTRHELGRAWADLDSGAPTHVDPHRSGIESHSASATSRGTRRTQRRLRTSVRTPAGSAGTSRSARWPEASGPHLVAT